MEILDKIIEHGILKSQGEIVRELFVGVFLTYAKSKNYGITYTYRDSLKPPHLLPDIRHRGSLRGMKAREIIPFIKSENPLEVSIGLAVLNSVLQTPADAVELENFGDYLVSESQGKKVAMIGYFPFMDEVKKAADRFYLFERTLDSQDAERDLSPLSDADILITTGTIIINHSIEEILRKAENCRVIIVGPSAPFSCVLFDFGVDEIISISVENPKLMINSLSEGVIVPEIKGIKFFCWKRR